MKSLVNRKSLIQNISLILCCVLMLSVFMLGNSSVAFCADGDPVTAITDGVVGLATKGYLIMLIISCPLVAVMFCIAGFQIIGGGPQGIQKGKGTLLNACLGLVLIAFAPVLAKSVASMLSDSFSGDLNDYNPFAQ